MKKLSLAIIVLLIISLAGGCVFVRRVERKMVMETRTVELEGARSVEANISMKMGELRIRDGGTPLLKGKFAYSSAFRKPEISYSKECDKGMLIINSNKKSPSPVFLGDSLNKWTLRLNKETPLDLRVELGAGKSRLSLKSLNLLTLDLDNGAGETTIDLAGHWDHDVDVNIDSGVGKMTLTLPKKFGVRVGVDHGIGKTTARGFKRVGDYFLNDAYTSSDNTLDIEIDHGVGEIKLKLAD